MLVNYPWASLAGYKQTFNINWIFKNHKSRGHKTTGIFKWTTLRPHWVATYIHLLLPGFSKTLKATATQAQAS